jgi:hypothetical protein
VFEKSYGRYFIESLPPAPVRKGPWSEMLDELRSFYTTAPDYEAELVTDTLEL